MPRELRRLLILLLVLAVLGAGVVWGGRPALYASGLWIDVVEQVAPRPGYWDTYLRGTG